MKGILIAILTATLAACSLVPAIAPDDWAYHPVQPPPASPPDTCANYIPVLEPAFVSGYMYLEEPIFTDIRLIVGPHAVTIPEGQFETFGPILDSLLQLFHPEWSYDVAIKDGSDPRFTSFIVKGTNDIGAFNLAIQIRVNGYKAYFASEVQSFMFCGARTFEDCMSKAQSLPSMSRFNCINTAWDSLQYVDYALAILDSCKAGRDWADFRFNPYPMDSTILARFEDAGWDLVLHAPAWSVKPSQALVADLRGKRVSESEILTLLNAGYVVLN